MCNFSSQDPEQIFNNSNNVKNFKDDIPVKIVIHGFNADRYHESVEPVRKAYLSQQNVNLISVDWNNGAHRSYDEARQLIAPVGAKVGEILKDALRYIKNVSLISKVIKAEWLGWPDHHIGLLYLCLLNSKTLQR